MSCHAKIDFVLEFNLNGMKRCTSFRICVFLEFYIFFSNTILMAAGSDKHIFNTLCNNFRSLFL